MTDRTTEEAKREAFYAFRKRHINELTGHPPTALDAWNAALQWQAEQQKGEEEVIGTYGRGDGHRDWVSAGAWLREGDRIVVMRAPVSSLPQAPQGEQGC